MTTTHLNNYLTITASYYLIQNHKKDTRNSRKLLELRLLRKLRYHKNSVKCSEQCTRGILAWWCTVKTVVCTS